MFIKALKPTVTLLILGRIPVSQLNIQTSGSEKASRKAMMWAIPHAFVYGFVIYLTLVVTYLPKSFIQANFKVILYIQRNFTAECCPELSQLGLKIDYGNYK